jgi:hypothetical protein
LWVLRSTLTLKNTDTTLVSVDGSNGPRGALVHLPDASPETIAEVQRGALVRLPDASPETIAEETPSATSHQHSPMDVVRLDLGLDRAPDQVLAQE